MAVWKPDDELSWNNREEVLRLPVPPQNSPELYTPGQNETWKTTDVGSFKAIGYPGLKTVTIESFFPAQVYTFCTYSDFPTPEECVAMIERWQQSRRPIRYIRTGLINDAFSIEGFTWHKEMGTGDIVYKLDLEQYRFIEQANPSTGNKYRADVKYNDITEDSPDMILLPLVKGTTLCQLADEYLGDSDRYMEIFEANAETMTDPGHPWNYDMEERGEPQTVIIPMRPGDPIYERYKDPVVYTSEELANIGEGEGVG
jgi:hypothetical protein